MKNFGNMGWWQNIQEPEIEPLNLTASYDPKLYPTYGNYNAINVGSLKSIPKDYYGVMGVPITFFSKYNSKQFEIVGCPSADSLPDGWKGMTQEFLDLYFGQGKTAHFTVGNRMPYIIKDGRAFCPFTRILVRRKQ